MAFRPRFDWMTSASAPPEDDVQLAINHAACIAMAMELLDPAAHERAASELYSLAVWLLAARRAFVAGRWSGWGDRA